MKRTDRLYALMTRLKDGGLHRAEDLATELGVSLRTIYRDMDTLAASGVPVEGERGLGYTARATITLPPMNLTDAELEALHIGLAAVAASDMPEQADAARTLASKMDAVLPEDAGMAARSFGFATYPFSEAAQGFRHMPAIRAALRARQKLRLTFLDDAKTHDVRPLHMDYWGRIWTCIAWDETDGAFNSFRIDRVDTLRPLPGLFVDEPGKSLKDFQALEKAKP